MPTNFQDIQRHMFWSCVPSGAVGHTGISSHAYLAIVTATNGTWKAPHVPSPQDWVLVLEQAGVGVARCEKTIGQRWRLVTFTPDDAGFDQATALLKRERANAVLSRPAFIIEKP
ncbi:MAG: hypothetical protein EA424_01610 [Planctomycetaceae bacterium]|nr:MAG: hypothetical protein EA424_01610 [Planctomycetaceae bacterium]